MADIDTAVNIAVCNQALGLLGASAIILDGTSENHGHCVTFFAKARDEILAAHKWNFAKKRAYAIQTTDPLFGYSNAFTKPSDCLKVWRIDDDNAAKFEVEGDLILTDLGADPPDYDDDEVDYLAGQYISYDDVTYLVDTAFTSSEWATDADYCTSQSGDYKILKVEYVYQHTILSSYPIYAESCVVINLARMLCSPIKQSENVALNLQAMLYGGPKNYGYLQMAKSFDAQEGGGEKISTKTWLESRR